MTNQKNGLETKEAMSNAQLEQAIPKFNFENAKTTFEDEYTAKAGLHARVIKIQYTPALKAIFTLANYSGPDGLVFHYGFNPYTKCLSYLIGPGTTNGGNFTPSPIPNLFGSDPGYLEISEDSLSPVPRRLSEFDALTKDYWCNIIRSSAPINTITPEHARMVFHPRAELVSFDSEYSYITSPYLYFYHGASMNRPHTLMIRFGNDAGPLGIDDIDYTLAPYSGTRYTKKAFNIGQLCPPGCASVAPNCPTTP